MVLCQNGKFRKLSSQLFHLLALKLYTWKSFNLGKYLESHQQNFSFSLDDLILKKSVAPSDTNFCLEWWRLFFVKKIVCLC